MNHYVSDALNLSSLNPPFVKAMQKAWSRETCWEGCAHEYDRYKGKNPAFGNCLVTVLAAWADENFLDHVNPALAQVGSHPPRAPVWHFNLNRMRDGMYDYIIDPTLHQFPPRTPIESVPRYGATAAIHNRMIYESFFEPAARASLEKRLTLFIERLYTEGGYKLFRTPKEILQKLDEKFAYANPKPAAAIEPGGML